MEKLFTGRAPASRRRGLLAELTEAYYLDDEVDCAGEQYRRPALPLTRPRTEDEGSVAVVAELVEVLGTESPA